MQKNNVLEGLRMTGAAENVVHSQNMQLYHKQLFVVCHYTGKLTNDLHNTIQITCSAWQETEIRTIHNVTATIHKTPYLLLPCLLHWPSFWVAPPPAHSSQPSRLGREGSPRPPWPLGWCALDRRRRQNNPILECKTTKGVSPNCIFQITSMWCSGGLLKKMPVQMTLSGTTHQEKCMLTFGGANSCHNHITLGKR